MLGVDSLGPQPHETHFHLILMIHMTLTGTHLAHLHEMESPKVLDKKVLMPHSKKHWHTLTSLHPSTETQTT